MSYRYVVVLGANSSMPCPLEYRSVDNERAYRKAEASYHAAVARGMSAILYSNRGVHLRSWKPRRAHLVDYSV
jgi:hypothetical protein